MIGIILLTACMVLMFFIPQNILTISLGKLPVLGNVPVIGLVLMAAGASWALININSLPMVVDMTDDLHIGTYTGLYYMFSTMAAIVGPNLNGLIVQLNHSDYSTVMIIGPIFMVIAFVMMLGVKRGEVKGSVES